MFVQEQAVFHANGLQKFISKKKEKKCPMSGYPQYSLWLHSGAFLSWICDLLSESFSFSEQKTLWEKKAWGWGSHTAISLFFFFVCCFLPVSEECWNSSDLPQHLSELRATEGLNQAMAGFPAGLFSWGGAAGQAPPRNSSWKGAALLLTDALHLLRSSSFYCSFYTSFSENHLFKVIGSL